MVPAHVFVLFVEAESSYATQAGLKLLILSSFLASASQSTGITDAATVPAWPLLSLKS